MSKFANRKNSGSYILRIEYGDKRAENRLYKTETGARKAGQKIMKKYEDTNCRIFKEIGSVVQLSLFDLELPY